MALHTDAAQFHGENLRVMTYNIHHGSGNDNCTNPFTPPGEIPLADCALDLPRIAEVILAEQPDIVAVQEIDRFWARSGGIDQVEDLAQRLGMHVGFGANLSHDPDAHSATYHEFGVATFSRFPLVHVQNHLLPNIDGWEQRGVLDTRFDMPEIGEVAVLNTHLQVSLHGDAVGAIRQRMDQAQAIATHAAALNIPVIVLGDFNTEVSSGELDSLVGSGAAFRDVWSESGSGSGATMLSGLYGQLQGRIDHIFIDDAFTAKRAEVIDTELSRMASDHLPLLAELEAR